MPDVEPSDRSSPQLRQAEKLAVTWEWIFYTLNLDSDSIESFAGYNALPWKPILRRARELVQKHISQDEKLLNAFVDLFWEETKGKDRLCSLLDINLDADLRALPPPHIVNVLRTALTGGHTPSITVDIYDPRSASHAALAMRTFMRHLQNLYDEKACSDAVVNMRDDIDYLANGQTPYQGLTGCLLLAHVTNREKGAFIGGACLQRRDDVTCEIRYLWVNPRYRGARIGKEIVTKAISVASDLFQCTDIYVEILENVVLTAAALFKEMGFERSNRKPSADKRIVLTKSLSTTTVAARLFAATN